MSEIVSCYLILIMHLFFYIDHMPSMFLTCNRNPFSERFMLVQNVFDECRGFEYHLSRSASCSPTIERILALGTAFQLRKFMAALSGDTEKCA